MDTMFFLRNEQPFVGYSILFALALVLGAREAFRKRSEKASVMFVAAIYIGISVMIQLPWIRP